MVGFSLLGNVGKTGGIASMGTVQNEDRLVLSVPEVAVILGISRNHAYGLAAKGAIPGSERLGKRIIISRARFFAWLNGNEAN